MPLKRTIFTIPVEIEKSEFDIKIRVDLNAELTIPDSIIKNHMADSGLTKKEYIKWHDKNTDEWYSSIIEFLHDYLGTVDKHLISEDEALFLKDWVLLSYEPFGCEGGYPKETYCTFTDNKSEFTVISFFWDSGDKFQKPYMLAYKNESIERTVIENEKIKIVREK